MPLLLFAYTFRRAQSDDVTPLLHGSLAANGLSVLALAAGLAGKTANPFLYALKAELDNSKDAVKA